MVKILFVCHGNICRSPMGEFILKDMARKAGRQGDFEIASAATSREELGNPVSPCPVGACEARHFLRRQNCPSGHRSGLPLL